MEQGYCGAMEQGYCGAMEQGYCRGGLKLTDPECYVGGTLTMHAVVDAVNTWQ